MILVARRIERLESLRDEILTKAKSEGKFTCIKIHVAALDVRDEKAVSEFVESGLPEEFKVRRRRCCFLGLFACSPRSRFQLAARTPARSLEG